MQVDVRFLWPEQSTLAEQGDMMILVKKSPKVLSEPFFSK
jgi:hypothetical protein